MVWLCAFYFLFRTPKLFLINGWLFGDLHLLKRKISGKKLERAEVEFWFVVSIWFGYIHYSFEYLRTGRCDVVFHKSMLYSCSWDDFWCNLDIWGWIEILFPLLRAKYCECWVHENLLLNILSLSSTYSLLFYQSIMLLNWIKWWVHSSSMDRENIFFYVLIIDDYLESCSEIIISVVVVVTIVTDHKHVHKMRVICWIIALLSLKEIFCLNRYWKYMKC